MAAPSPSAAARRTSPNCRASPPPQPPPPPLRGWLAGLVSGAGRLIAAVLGPDSTTTSDAAAASSPSTSSSPSSSPPPHCGDANGDHSNASLLRKNDQLIQREKGKELKEYVEESLAIVSEINSKDAIMQLLMQETYSRDESNTLIKIIQSRVVDSKSDGFDPGRIALPIAWLPGGQSGNAEDSSFSPNVSSPVSSSHPARTPDFDRNAVVVAKRCLDTKRSTAILTPNDQGPCTMNAGRIKPVLKRSYSIAGDTLDSCRVRPKLTGTISFKQVDVVRDREFSANDRNAFRGFLQEANKQLAEVPLLGTENLTLSDIISKRNTADAIVALPSEHFNVHAQPFASASSQAVGDYKNYDSAIFMPDCYKDMKLNLPVKVEPLNVCVPLGPHMMDLTSQKHEDTILDDSSSVSKLMLKEDIETASISSMGMRPGNGSGTGRRRGVSSQRPTRTTRPPPKRSRRQNNGIMVKSEHDLLDQSRQILMGQEGNLCQTVGRTPGRPRKARGR